VARADAAHIHLGAPIDVLSVDRMQPIHLCVRSFVKIGGVVTLNGLVPERNPDRQNKRQHEPQPAASARTSECYPFHCTTTSRKW
jgi:hypothetical protein